MRNKEDKQMTKYMGYYIDGVIFTSKQDIDNFLEKTAIEKFKTAVELFAEHPSVEASMWQTDKAERLVNAYGYTWEQVEEIEISVLKIINEKRRA
jgi:hypothetical protein